MIIHFECRAAVRTLRSLTVHSKLVVIICIKQLNNKVCIPLNYVDTVKPIIKKEHFRVLNIRLATSVCFAVLLRFKPTTVKRKWFIVLSASSCERGERWSTTITCAAVILLCGFKWILLNGQSCCVAKKCRQTGLDTFSFFIQLLLD